jgi:hypothetical protein
MEGGASHAKEDAELQNRSSVSYEGLLIFFGVLSHCQPGLCRGGMHQHLRSNWPNLQTMSAP